MAFAVQCSIAIGLSTYKWIKVLNLHADFHRNNEHSNLVTLDGSDFDLDTDYKHNLIPLTELHVEIYNQVNCSLHYY